MSFVIYDRKSTVIVENSKTHVRNYKTEGAAKSARTRFVKNGTILNEDDYPIAEYGFFKRNIEKTHMVRNIMSGLMVEESVNTPYSCSVASEAYFSS